MAQKISLRALVAWALVAAVWWMGLLATPATAIWLSIPSSGTKCVSEEIHSNVVVLADYYVVHEFIEVHDQPPQHIPTISVRVTNFVKIRCFIDFFDFFFFFSKYEL